MSIVVPNEGMQYLLDLLLKKSSGEILPFWLRLFSNDVTLDADTVRADLTEMNYDGYSPVELVRADWSSAIISDGMAQSTWGDDRIEFLADSGSQTCYGLMVTDYDDNFVLWGENRVPGFVVSAFNPLFVAPVMRLRGFA